MTIKKVIAATSIAALAGVGALSVNASAKQSTAANTQDVSQYTQLAQCAGKCGAKGGAKCGAKCGAKGGAKCGAKCGAKK